MPYHISVHTPQDGGWRRDVYHKSLGPDDNVFAYWHLPALDLGLPLLAQIYHEGLDVHGHQLDTLELELQKLAEYWEATHVGRSEQIPHSVTQPDGTIGQRYVWVCDYLRERVSYVGEAVRVAKESKGVIEIS